MRDIESINSELRLVATLRRAASERGGPLPPIDVADALLDPPSTTVVRMFRWRGHPPESRRQQGLRDHRCCREGDYEPTKRDMSKYSRQAVILPLSISNAAAAVVAVSLARSV
jgi:hypothetical protein